MKKERFEQRLFRIFAQAGYPPIRILTVTPEEMVEIPGVTVPEIRAVLCVQNKVLDEPNTVRKGRLVAELIKAAQEREVPEVRERKNEWKEAFWKNWTT